MERQFPKNVRQVGNVSDTPKIYVEDYVDTYLNQIKDKAKEKRAGAFLVGEYVTINEQECVYITGALWMKNLNTDSTELQIEDSLIEEGKKECAEFFEGKKIVGWYLAAPGRPVVLDNKIVNIHEKNFSEKNSVFILRDSLENEEAYFAYKYHELMQMGGHYVFYEKNPAMQNYMISSRRKIGVTPSEMVEDRAAKDFRSTVRERMELQEQRANSRLVYVTSVLLVVIVMAIGISTMNNYDKMNSVQNSIETLSETVRGNADSKNAETAEAAADEPKAEAAETEEKAPEEEKTSEGTELPTSTIQEELSEQDYYIVQRGDTLDKISLRLYGNTEETEAICKMNGLSDGNLIFIGQKLLLP